MFGNQTKTSRLKSILVKISDTLCKAVKMRERERERERERGRVD